MASDESARMEIGRLILSGKMDQLEVGRIGNLFPNTELVINGKRIRAL